MTSLLKYIATSLSNPITATPNALGFSSPSATQVAPSSFSPSKPNAITPSHLSSPPAGSVTPINKRKRFRGWVCEDEIRESEPALLEKMESHGREFSAAPVISSTKRHAGTPSSSTGLGSSSSGAVRNLKTKQHKIAALQSNNASPSNRRGSLTSIMKRKIKAVQNRKHQTSLPSKPKPNPHLSHNTSPPGPIKSHGSGARLPEISTNGDGQSPRKRPRFRGYVCEDEVEEENPALADEIRRRGSLFQLNEDAEPSKSSAQSLIEGKKALRAKNNPIKTQLSKVPNTSLSSNDNLTSKIAGQPKKSQARSRHATQARSGPTERRTKKRHRTYSSQHRTSTTLPQPVFPNLQSNTHNLPSATSPLQPAPEEESARLTKLERAQQLVTRSASEFKNLTAIADQAAKAATIAKRKADDAANQLEAAKRGLREQNERESARKSGRRFQKGWAEDESDGKTQGGTRGASRRRETEAGNDAESVEKSQFKQVGQEKEAFRIDIITGADNVWEDEDEDEDEYDEEDDDEVDRDLSTNDDADADEEFDSSDSEGEFATGRTADLLG